MNRLRDGNQGKIIGFDTAANRPIVRFPHANLNTVVESVGGTGQHAFLELATNDGNSAYNAMAVSLRRRFEKGLGLQFSYTWSHGLSDYVDNLTGGATPANAYDYGLERSNSPFDIRHRFVANAIYALPFGRGGSVLADLGALSYILGGWQVNTILSMQTGLPFGVSASDVSYTGSNHASRPNLIGDPFAGASQKPSEIVSGGTGFFINPAAFASPANGTFGNVPPRAFHGPGSWNVDLSLFKSFRISEGKRIEFRTEFFNAFNHPNFGNPAASITNLGGFGKISSTIGDPRDIQFALKIYF
jgi:hypothetical protein